MRYALVIVLLGIANSGWAFNEAACDRGQAGENNPHCLGSQQVNAVPEPGVLELLGLAGAAGALSRLRKRNRA